MAVDKLITPKYNPRTISDHDMEQLKKSLLGFDAVQPAVVNMFKGREGIIVGGNQRVRAAKELGWSEFPCVVVNLPEHKEKELNVRLNRNSGLFDDSLLIENFSKDALRDFGFEDTELEDIFKNPIGDMSAIKNPAEDDNDEETIETVDQNELDTEAYCCVKYHMDIGRSKCSHNCLYCFTQTTPAGLSIKEGRFKLTKRDVITNFVKNTAKIKSVMSVGACNDPSLPEFRERLLFLLTESNKHKCQLLLNTKNPLVIIKAIQEAGTDPALITVRTAFSFCNDDASAFAEPGAPRYSARLSGLIEAQKGGCDVILRFHPYFVDYYEGMEKTMDALKGKCDRMTVTPIRTSATGKHYYKRIEPLLTKDKKSLEYYVDRVKDQKKPMSGALHWYTYDSAILRASYEKLCGWGHERGFKFGICDGTFGAEHADLMDGEYCCQTDRQIKNNTGYVNTALAHLLSSGKIDDLFVKIFKDHPEVMDDAAKIRPFLYNLAWVNNPSFNATYLNQAKSNQYAKTMRKK